MNAMDTPVPSPEGFDPAPRFGPLLWLVGADREALRHCPQSEERRLASFGLLLGLGFLYLSFILIFIAHRLFSSPGHVRIELIVGAIFLSGFLAAIDSIMVIQSGLFRSGEEELKRAGLDITGGQWVAFKSGFFLVFRILLSISIAALTGIFVALCLFAADVDARIHAVWPKANAPLIAVASSDVDARKALAVNALKDEEQRYNALSKQALVARQNQLDPLANDPAIQQAQAEIARLTEQKGKDDEEVRRAERFATDEAGGIQGSAKNSGRAGNGPRHRAALDQVLYARAHAKATAHDLSEAQSRLELQRTQLSASGDTIKKKAVEQTPEFEKALAVEGREHERLKAEVARLGDDRDATIQKLVEQAPGYVPADQGLLMQLKLLGEITDSDRKLKLVVILIEIASFGFELAAVLAKTMSYNPLSYTARIARDVYLRCVDIVDETAASLNGKRRPDDGNDDGLMPAFVGPPMGPLGDPPAGFPAAVTAAPFEVFGDVGDPPAATDPPKRKRGRPRKNALH